jgi:hypothetical protein
VTFFTFYQQCAGYFLFGDTLLCLEWPEMATGSISPRLVAVLSIFFYANTSMAVFHFSPGHLNEHFGNQRHAAFKKVLEFVKLSSP